MYQIVLHTENGWARGHDLAGAEGFFPSSFVKTCTEEEVQLIMGGGPPNPSQATPTPVAEETKQPTEPEPAEKTEPEKTEPEEPVAREVDLEPFQEIANDNEEVCGREEHRNEQTPTNLFEENRNCEEGQGQGDQRRYRSVSGQEEEV